MEALEEIPKYGKVFDSYSKEGSNAYFFLTYGFIQQPNQNDTVKIKLKLDINDRFYKLKSNLLSIPDGQEFRCFNVCADLSHQNTQEMI